VSAPAPYLPVADLALVRDDGCWRVGHPDAVPSLRLTSGEPAGLVDGLRDERAVDEVGTRLVDELCVLEAARLVGLGKSALALAVAYASARRQFGRPIGSFQALQHRLADHATALDAARLLAYRAAWGLDVGDRGSASTVAADPAAAYRWCGQTVRALCADVVQVHGGYGFTLEFDAQLYLRRARAWSTGWGEESADWAAVGDARLRGGGVPRAVGGGRELLDAGLPADGLDFGLPPEIESWRREVRSWLDGVMTEELRREMRTSGTFDDPRLRRALAARGWIGRGWERDVGAGSGAALEAAVFAEEAGYAHAPVDGLQTNAIVARTLLRVGTPDQRRRFVEPIRSGRMLVCLAFTEPEAGSDVASVMTRATRDGEVWTVDGAKMFTTLAHVSDYAFLLARTNASVGKHEGLTVFLVPLDAPGVEIRPVATLGGERTNATFYDGVRVPDANRVGEVDGGWSVLTLALDVERAGADYAAQARRVVDETLAALAQRSGGARVAAPVRELLARLTEDVRAAELLAWRVAWLESESRSAGVEASMAKLLGAVVLQRVCERCLDVLGPAGLVSVHDDPDRAEGLVEEAWRHSLVTSIYGGTNEIQRTIIATRGLGLPRG
jgi:alkylation response protein AidB-like acyl-CoA dehydrogenase